MAVGTGAYLFVPDSSGPGGRAPAANAAGNATERGIAVEAQRVTISDVTEDIHAVGTLRPNESLFVAPEIAGRVAKIHFNEGEKVKAGDVLLELDSAILRAEMAKARSD